MNAESATREVRYFIEIDFPVAGVPDDGPRRLRTRFKEGGTLRVDPASDSEGVRDWLVDHIGVPDGCSGPGTVVVFHLTEEPS